MNTFYSSNAVTVILRGHVAIEGAIDRLIRCSCVLPDAIDVEAWTFARKLSLVYAFGLIDEDSIGFYRGFNTLRNRVAHTDPEVSEADLKCVYGHLSGHLRRACDMVAAADQDALQMMIISLVAVRSELEVLCLKACTTRNG